MKIRTRLALAAFSAIVVTGAVVGQMPSPEERARIEAGNAAERNRELKLLGITAMQPGVTAYDIGKPGNANYDESKANPFPKLPELMTLQNGTKVKTRAQWEQRRKEIKALFDDDIYGKFPATIPSVSWTVAGTEETAVSGVPAVVKHLVGHTDNSAYPAITVDIHADLVTPVSAKGKKVPVIIGGGSTRPRPVRPPAAAGQPVHMLSMPENPPDSSELLLKHGWGFVSRVSNEVQADNGAGLTSGIIGLVNKGQPRSLDDWGVLRAWGWGDSRIVDYLLTDPDVDGTKIGVTGHSRGGKAALVAMVDDPRIAIGYISSSGAGGANLYRRNYGEAMGNLAGNSEFHWFAGNFLRYAAAGHTTNEMPVDSHEFIALAAPRALFIGGGAFIEDPKYLPGDAWQDAQGMFMAAAAASPAWEVYGVKGLNTSTFPPMNTFVNTGRIAFRQHQYGHTPAPNWPYFIEFADRIFQGK
ncbi:alpha/beta hydrolase family protein [Terriglobus albidus]|uniref:alpha/beta hydrolase family protein n=1 Tax=Terriglobus albidus TaxID=1592106 RepID=UPI0021E0D9CE|nr:acetylxylan esterase [Terriglobus albidus]